MNSNEDRHWFKLPVPLKWLQGLDDVPAANGLPDAFGDRYLCLNNPIYARIREAALALGYRFSSEDTPLWRDYQAFPLTTLHRILREKTIPYFDTGSTVSRLLEMNPKAALTPAFLIGNLKTNHAFHEAAHCVANSVIRQSHCESVIVASGERDLFVLEALLAESFANVVERLASGIGQRPISDSVFYVLNSYASLNAASTALLAGASASINPLLRFIVLFLGSFEANLTGEGPVDATYRRIAVAVGCLEEQMPALNAVVEAAFGLSKGFRENTNPTYFDLLAHGPEYRALTESKWLNDGAYQHFAQQIARKLYASVCDQDTVKAENCEEIL